MASAEDISNLGGLHTAKYCNTPYPLVEPVSYGFGNAPELSQLNRLLTDCRFAVRVYLRTPGASSTAIVVLAVGLAFVVAFLSLYVHLALRPHPGFLQSGRIATIGQNIGTSLLGIPYEIVETLSDDMATIDAAAAAVTLPARVGRDSEEILTGMVSAEFFDGLRPRIELGRGFGIADHAPDAEPVVVLSYRYWQSEFGGDPNILGRFIDVARDASGAYLQAPGRFPTLAATPDQDSAQFKVVGVMSRNLRGIPSALFASPETALWIPMERAWPLFVGVPESLPGTIVSTFVRRSPGNSATAVTSELLARFQGPDSAVTFFPGARLEAIDGFVRDITRARELKRQLQMFLAGSVLLALVTAANVSLFLISRASGRRRELGIRMSVGATINRLARQLATEAGLLIAFSTALGLLMSVWIAPHFRSLALFQDADWRDFTMLDWRVLVIAAVFLLVLALTVSLAPILGVMQGEIASQSRQVTARASASQRLAVSVQVAGVGAAGAAAISFAWYLGIQVFSNPGYEISELSLIDGSGPDNAVELERRREAIGGIPGVESVAFGYPVPGMEMTRLPTLLPHPSDPLNVVEVYTGSFERRFIDMLNLKVLSGRVPDDELSTVVLVNRTLALSLWGHDDVVGERLPGSSRWGREGVEIAAVLEDVSFEHPLAVVKPLVFLPLNMRSGSTLTLVDAHLTAAALSEALAQLADSGDLEFQATNVRSLAAIRNNLIASDRARGILTIATTVLIIALATFGCYGTQRYLVSVGRREFAIRSALGADPGSIGRLVLWRSFQASMPGLVTGGLLAIIVVAWLRDRFVSRDVSLVLVTTSVVVGLVLLLLGASLAPALEARRTQPAPLLRED